MAALHVVSKPSVTEKRFVLSHAPAMIPAAEAVYLNLASGVPCVLKPIWSTASLRKSKKIRLPSSFSFQFPLHASPEPVLAT
jgi:hypothetical protein